MEWWFVFGAQVGRNLRAVCLKKEQNQFWLPDSYPKVCLILPADNNVVTSGGEREEDEGGEDPVVTFPEKAVGGVGGEEDEGGEGPVVTFPEKAVGGVGGETVVTFSLTLVASGCVVNTTRSNIP